MKMNFSAQEENYLAYKSKIGTTTIEKFLKDVVVGFLKLDFIRCFLKYMCDKLIYKIIGC